MSQSFHHTVADMSEKPSCFGVGSEYDLKYAKHLGNNIETMEQATQRLNLIKLLLSHAGWTIFGILIFAVFIFDILLIIYVVQIFCA
jgi:hypothetical protein